MKESLENYRSQLVEDIKNETDLEKRKAILASEKNTIRYKDSEEEHRKEALDKVAENREIKDEEGGIREEREKLEKEKDQIQSQINELEKKKDEIGKKQRKQTDLLEDIEHKRSYKKNPEKAFKEILQDLDYALKHIGYGSGGSMAPSAIKYDLHQAQIFLDVCGDNKSLDIETFKNKTEEVAQKLPSYDPLS